MNGKLRNSLVSVRRLLGLEPSAQAQVFDFYQACLEATIENAKRDGKYDDGIVDISGTNVTLAEPPRTVLTVSLISRNLSAGRPGKRSLRPLALSSQQWRHLLSTPDRCPSP